ncbi:hypothetical protein DWU98_17510 [Dyella monticola]|uniref:Uncharacterized protein n=2 Tax=Dyella monticola TaxID=1927958 RepID=A0A370WU95_9GAMM|nr:hypothetical protein DWU98_17510 [Dyella monticola]
MRNAFKQDVDAIAGVLIEVFGLRFKKEVEHLSDPLERWFDFACRFVPPLPRQVIFSDQFPKQLPSDAKRGLKHFLRRVCRGEDINPYQGRGLKLRHDTSGADRTARTDFLYASWNVLHFHLSNQPIPRERYFSKPADWLAFCVVTNEQLGLIDVVRHPAIKGFSDPAIFEALARNWPDYVEPHRMKGVLPGRAPTQDEIHEMRMRGGNPAYVHNGHAYIGPGGGYSAAGTPMKTAKIMMHLTRALDWLAEYVWDSSSPYQQHERLLDVTAPRFALRLYPEGLGLFEEKTSTFFAHPRQDAPSMGSVRWLSDMLLPPWALSEVLRQKHRFNSLFFLANPKAS